MESNDYLRQRYPDLLADDSDAAMQRLVRDLDSVARAAQPPKHLMGSIGWTMRHAHRQAISRVLDRARATPMALRGALAAALALAVVGSASLSGATAYVLQRTPFASSSPRVGAHYPPSCPVITNPQGYELWSLGSGIGPGFVGLHMQNIGKDIPHFVLSVDSRRSWRLGGITASSQAGRGGAPVPIAPRTISTGQDVHVWDFRRLPTCGVLSIRITTKATGAARLQDPMKVYANVLPSGQPDPRTVIFTGADDLR